MPDLITADRRSNEPNIASNLWLAAILIIILSSIASGQARLQPHPITLKNGRKFDLNVPAGYEIIPAAEGMKRVRFFAKAPDGRLFVTDMFKALHRAIVFDSGPHRETATQSGRC